MRLMTLLAAVVLSLPLAAQAEPRAEFLAASTADLENPHDVVLSPDGHYLLVSDVGNNRVVFLDPETLAFIGAFGSDHQAGTHDVAFDGAGRLYVADTHSNRATIYALDGTEGRLVGELSERVRGVEGVLPHPNGRVYVGGAWSNNVVVFEGGKVVDELTGLSSPHDLELTPEGDIWLSDSGNDRMLLLSPALDIKAEWSGAPFNFRGVRYQDVLPDGTVIAADKNNHQVKVISAAGEVLLVIGDGAGKGPGLFRTPEGVEAKGDIVWLSDSGNDRIVKYRLTLD